jgi:predicted Zn-dependent protease
MVLNRNLVIGVALVTALLATGVSEARRKLLLVSSAQMDQMGAEAFDKLKATDKLARDPRRLAQAQCVVSALVRALPERMARQAWEVQVFDDPNPNAFALPGGKVGVNTGMFAVIQSQDELAAVIGHEIAHVSEQHANERISRQMLVGAGLEAVGAYTGQRTSPERAKATMGLLGLGAQVGVMLPNSRSQEASADRLGQETMARAGFNPDAAVLLWQHMMGASKNGAPPQILSTHPDPQNRIRELAARAPTLRAPYQAARASGRRPTCF